MAEENEKIQQLTEACLQQAKELEQIFYNQIVEKDQIIEKLHRELDETRKAAEGSVEDQLMKQVIKIRIGMKRCISDENWVQLSAEDVRKQYQYLYEDITDLLNLQGIDEFSSNEGEMFDAGIHNARLEKTDNLSLDKKVHQSISEGYRKNNKVLIPERVSVYQYKE